MTSSSANIDKIRRFILDKIALGRGITALADEESLVERGVIDSLGIFQLVSFLEETFGVQVGDDEILLENFSTILDIDHFVRAKLAAE
ncbi:MAG TPA: acyl carrier protein [Candidatus Krumholzibacteria bacterium]|nr:acyl carrier protein [Candidatus Krumholzibacteria bacterium]